MLSDVVRYPAQNLPVRDAVEVAEGEAGELCLDLCPQPLDGALADHRCEARLKEARHRGAEVKEEHDEKDLPDVAEVDTAWRDVGRVEQIGESPLAGPAELGDRLRLAYPGGDRAADHPGEDEVRRVAEEARSKDGEGDASTAKGDDRRDAQMLRGEFAEQPQPGGLEVQGFLGGAATPHQTAWSETLGSLRPASLGGRRLTDTRRWPPHAASSSVS